MGISIDEPSLVFGNNQSSLAKTHAPNYTLKKKSSSIALHFVCEGNANNEWLKTYLKMNLNLSYILKTYLPRG